MTSVRNIKQENLKEYFYKDYNEKQFLEEKTKTKIPDSCIKSDGRCVNMYGQVRRG